MTELDSRGRALLEHYQANQAAPPEVTDRVWEAVQSRAAAGDLGPEMSGASGSAGGVSVATKVGLGLGGCAVVVALAAFVVGPGASVEPAGPDASPPAPTSIMPATDDSEPEPDAVAAVTDTEVAPAPAPDEAAVDGLKRVEENRPSGAVAQPAPKHVQEPTSEAAAGKGTSPQVEDGAAALPSELGPDLGPEVALMTKARAAMRAGDHRRALRLLDEHARAFPRGVFAKERELSRVTTLCSMGERDAATEAARRFAQRRPSARERLEKTCVGAGF